MTTVMSLGLGVTLLLTLALVGTNFQREIAKSIPDIAPDYFFVGIQKGEREKFEQGILNMAPTAPSCSSMKSEEAPPRLTACPSLGLSPKTSVLALALEPCLPPTITNSSDWRLK